MNPSGRLTTPEDVADAVLGPHCENYRIGSTTAIEIHPGEGHQVLHQDDEFYPMRIEDVEFQLGAMWALDDFTPENGATRVVPGSHWTGPVTDVENAPVAQAVMVAVIGPVAPVRIDTLPPTMLMHELGLA